MPEPESRRATPVPSERRTGARSEARNDDALLEVARELKRRAYRFTTVTPATHARINARPGNERALTIEDVFGWSRPFEPGVLDPRLLEPMQAAGALVPHGAGWRATLRASTLQGELFLHSAYPTTSSDAVFFGPDTYRFANAVADRLSAGRPLRRAVDVGCGAGPGAVLVARSCPAAEVFAVDINAAALRFTALNAAVAGTPNVIACRSDLLDGIDGVFDLIVANPPYLLDASERAYRHGGGSLGEGLSLAVIEAAAARLAPAGTLLLYSGSAVVGGVDRFGAAAKLQLDASGLDWSYREIDPDVFGEELDQPAYRGVERIAAVLLTATRAMT